MGGTKFDHIAFGLRPEDFERLKTTAATLGFRSPSVLAKTLVLKALNVPADVEHAYAVAEMRHAVQRVILTLTTDYLKSLTAEELHESVTKAWSTR